VAQVLGSVGDALADLGCELLDRACTDIGTQVQCSGKVAGLGGTTFTITVSAPGTTPLTCGFVRRISRLVVLAVMILSFGY
jgi:hypothetical protein